MKNYLQKGRIEAGCDEAGRGCLAGPVFAAAVILPDRFRIQGLNDSKKISEKQRSELRKVIEEKALAWSVASCDPKEIDQINILQASVKAMNKAISALSQQPDFLAIDGNYFHSSLGIPFETCIKGDGRFAHIAAASILAKTHRDEYMKELDEAFPSYGFARHKGYATAQHVQAIREFGYSEIHRKSFTLKKLQLALF